MSDTLVPIGTVTGALPAASISLSVASLPMFCGDKVAVGGMSVSVTSTTTV